MNLIQKHKSKISKIYLSSEDVFGQTSKLITNFFDFLSLTPIDYSIQIHFGELEDISIEFTGILISFIKTGNKRQTSITLIMQSKLSDLLFSLGTGSLKYSIELSEESK